MSRPNVLLFGLGSIGGVYACVLRCSGQVDVHVVARGNYEAVKKGYKLVNPKFGNQDEIHFAGVYRSCEEAAKSGNTFSHVLCATKALLDATPSLSDLLRPIVSPTTSIVLLQNGVGAEIPLHESFPDNTIISAVVWTGAKSVEGGVEQFNEEGLTIGVDYRDGANTKVKEEEDGRLRELTGWLEKGGGSCNVTEDIQSQRWIKVIWNCCWNSLTAVTRLRTGHIFASSPTSLPLCHTIMNEVASVARARGLSIPEDTVQRLIDKGRAAPSAGLPSSMMADCLAGRPMEVEVILGTPLREGDRLGVPVPTLRTLYTIVKALDYGNAHPEIKEG